VLGPELPGDDFVHERVDLGQTDIPAPGVAASTDGSHRHHGGAQPVAHRVDHGHVQEVVVECVVETVARDLVGGLEDSRHLDLRDGHPQRGQQGPLDFRGHAHRGPTPSLPPDDHSPSAHYLRTRTMRHRDWLLANEERQLLRRRWAAYFGDIDILITPAAPTAAVPDQTGVPIPERYITVDGERRGYWEQTTWLNLASLVHLPAATVPVGSTADGLPLGLQLIGPYLADHTVTRFANLLTQRLTQV
jgi:hypothetical protein